MATVQDNKINDEKLSKLTSEQLYALVLMVSEMSDEELETIASHVRARLIARQQTAEMVHRQTDETLDTINAHIHLLQRKIREVR